MHLRDLYISSEAEVIQAVNVIELCISRAIQTCKRRLGEHLKRNNATVPM